MLISSLASAYSYGVGMLTDLQFISVGQLQVRALLTNEILRPTGILPDRPVSPPGLVPGPENGAVLCNAELERPRTTGDPLDTSLDD